MLKIFLRTISILLSLILATSAFAYDFTLAPDGNRLDNAFDFISQWPITTQENRPGSPQKNYQQFYGEVSPLTTFMLFNDFHKTLTQYLSFDVVFQNLWSINPPPIDHLVIAATRGLIGPVNSYIDNNFSSQFKGLIIVPQNYSFNPGHPGSLTNYSLCPDMNSPRLLFEFSYPNMDPHLNIFGNRFPSAFFLNCADPNISFEDNVKYSFVIHSAEDGMAYWIYKNGVLISVNYIADNSFFQTIENGNTIGQSLVGQPVTMDMVKSNPTSARYVNMQITNDMVGIVPIYPDNTIPWKIIVTNLHSFWFLPN